MPAGLLLSPTARTVRSGPGRGPRGVAAAGRRFPCLAGRNDQRPVWGKSRGSCPLLRHAPSVVGAAAAALSAHTGPRTALPRAHPRQGGWGKGTATGPPIPSRVPHGFPPLPGETRILPALPLSREYRSRCLPAPPVASDPPPVFPLPDLLRSGASVPLLPGQKIVRSTSIFPAIPAPLCKEK